MASDRDPVGRRADSSGHRSSLVNSAAAAARAVEALPVSSPYGDVDMTSITSEEKRIRTEQEALTKALDTNKRLLSSILRRRNSLTLIYRLPDELLSMIFCLVKEYDEYEGCGHSGVPYTMAQVSGRFRGVAFATANLWTSLVVEFGPGRYAMQEVIPACVKHHLELSKTLPIHLFIPRHAIPFVDDETINYVSHVYNLITPHLTRCQTLTIDTDNQHYQFPLPSANVLLPVLEALKINTNLFDDDPGTDIHAILEAPSTCRLMSLELSHTGLRLRFEQVKALISLNLEYSALLPFTDASADVAPDDLELISTHLSVLHNAVNLKYLSICSGQAFVPSPSVDKACMANLQVLSLSIRGPFAAVQLFSSIDMPALSLLRISGVDDGVLWSFDEIFAVLTSRLPSLEVLNFSNSHSLGGVVPLRMLLDTLPRLLSFRCIKSMVTNELLDLFNPRDNTLPCPKLRVLDIGGVFPITPNIPEYVPCDAAALLIMLENRKSSAGAPRMWLDELKVPFAMFENPTIRNGFEQHARVVSAVGT